jgi:excinuclease ABC subunit C
VPRHVLAELGPEVRAQLEADLRLLRGGAVTVQSPQRGERLRILEIAQQNARLRLEQDLIKRQKRGLGAVEAVQHALGLAAPPRIIEGVDISHMAGHHTRAALVRFLDGEPDKSGYRIFSMRDVGEDAVDAGTAISRGTGREVDDYASLHEAVLRRLRSLVAAQDTLPDLLLIDGGAGQLDAARNAITEAGADVAVCSLAKKEEALYVPGRLHPIKLARSDAGLQLLQRVRDEAHRFGITQVRRKATARATKSPLDDVVGIGPVRRRELVQAFAGMEGLRQATAADLQRVPGINAELAARIVAALAEDAT